MPEVKGRSLEEIDEMFEANVSARKFKSYKCVGMLNLQEEKKGSDEGAWGDEKVRFLIVDSQRKE